MLSVGSTEHRAVKRRAFITLLGGTPAAWPLAAPAQQVDRVRRVGVHMYWAVDHAEGRARLTAFTQALQQLGWSEGRNLRIDTRATVNADDFAGTRRNWSRWRPTSWWVRPAPRPWR